MSVKNAAVASVCTAVLAVGASFLGGAPAHAGGRPVGVAFVHAWKNVYLHHGVTIVSASVRCKPGWEGGELDLRVTQGGSYADGFTDAIVTCDNVWYPERFTISGGYGTLHAGGAQISSQFIVNNVDSGDSAGAHEAGRVAEIHKGKPPRGHG
jgi:hypothetical protein